jgi:hypothetical protein
MTETSADEINKNNENVKNLEREYRGAIRIIEKQRQDLRLKQNNVKFK